MNHTAFTPQLLVLTAPNYGGMTRLSWPGWLVIYWDKFSHIWSWTPDMVTHPSTNWPGIQ